MTKSQTKVLDGLWSKLVKLKAKNECERCRRTDTLNSHHIFSRSSRSTRWDERNGCCLCAGHHVLNNCSAHKAPIEFVEFLKEKRGEAWYQQIRMIAGTPQKVDYNLTRLYLEQEIKNQSNL